ncbi:hypothetical protein AWB82_04947 [Caballeronia glebae]|uniref:Uncharacterized protein n=1 Tax=Caballeronia glebae TaxID=1777143 RepID=A0A158C3M5_9BURK|nr:hypothetical protein AWB82_04947 [Caballeronia glebae]
MGFGTFGSWLNVLFLLFMAVQRVDRRVLK